MQSRKFTFQLSSGIAIFAIANKCKYVGASHFKTDAANRTHQKLSKIRQERDIIGSFFYFGPRHITNPSHLRKFWVQKVIHKKLLNFSEKVHRHFKTMLHLCPKHLRRRYPLKIRPDFDLKELEIFWFQKICIFWSFWDIFKFYLQ